MSNLNAVWQAKKFYITTPIYYVNAKPHIGHAYTTVAADILSRYYKSMRRDVFFLTGTDEHGAKIAEAAEAAGRDPQNFCDTIAGCFQKTWKNLGIDYSRFIRTTDEDHKIAVAIFLNKLKEKDFLYEKDYTGLYCVACEKFLTEKELVGGKCPDHKRLPEAITEQNWFFKLTDFLDEIKNKIETDEILIAPEGAKREVLGLFGQGLEDFSISRQKVKWGIPVPWDKTQTIYVWVEALLNYWTAGQEKEKAKFWPPDLHLIGKDILKFHAIFWPAMLLAYGAELPNKIFVHGYFTIDNQKMSKTLGNVIDPNNLVKKYGADATRYLLMAQFPFGQDGDISEEKLEAIYNADLANGLGNLVARVAKFRVKNQELRIKNQGLEKYDNLMKDLQFYEVLKMILDKVKNCNNLIEQRKPWEIKEEEKQRKSLRDVVSEILAIAKMLKPFMPETANKILYIFKTGKSEILFPRVSSLRGATPKGATKQSH
ncbi:methionine--tRNA ligase [bacterium (Candidatus Torokbacteria) CG09_land_8_20_14_0_10_42_11]|nr:MAG: methionine--tRNA ligase [bacterium (Candidatus Torokbacteria) CG09_land_8_20_14_0_10_42_11]